MAPLGKSKEFEVAVKDETEAVFPMGHHGDVMACLSRNYRRLIVYKKLIHGTGLHYAAINSGDFTLQYCAAQLVKRVEDAEHMYGLLNRCQHPNIIKPTGFWLWDHFKEKDNKKENILEAFITYPLIDGSLMDVPREDLFLVEKLKETDKPNCTLIGSGKLDIPKYKAYGFTDEGSKDFCEILDAIEYINSQLPTTAMSGSTSLQNKYLEGPFPLSPLCIHNGRIYYNKIGDGKYKISFGNFYTELPNHMRERNQRGGRKEPTVDHIKHANWKGVADFLDALLKKNELEPNDELAHLLEKLKEKSSINYCDLVWEPGLWTTMVKIHFVREVYWSIKGDRKSVLENTNPLGIKTFMTKLGYSSNQEKSLLDSILFLRKRVVAHQDTTYLSYNGDKNEVGESKRSVELLLQKTKADYMIELVSHIRRLGWLIESPILRSKTQYMEAFRQSKK